MFAIGVFQQKSESNMAMVRCWLCGHEVDLSQINLMVTYERYLVLTFILSVLLRFRQYKSNLQFALQFPQQWPGVLEVIKQHSTIFLTWTTLLPVGLTLAVLLSHTVCYRLIWSEASVTPQMLKGDFLVLALLIPVSLWMIFLDLKGLFNTSQMDIAEIEKTLSQGEFALTSKALGALRFASFGLFNPRKLVENRVADSMQNIRLALLVQLRKWSFHTAVRITFGFLLWLSYAVLSQRIGTATFLGYVAVLGLWLGAASWWSFRSAETPATETTE